MNPDLCICDHGRHYHNAAGCRIEECGCMEFMRTTSSANGHRYRVVRLTAESFVGLLKQGTLQRAVMVENPLPADARFVRAGHDQTGDLFLVVESESFDEVANMGAIPEHPPTLFRVVP